MTEIGDRISFVDHGTKTTIVILPKKQAWAIAAMGAWLAMWLTIGFTCIWALFVLLLKDQEKIILWVFLTFWLYYAFRVARSFLWLLWGQEMLKIDELGMHLKKSIKKYGKSIPYYYENIKGLTYIVPEERSFQSVWESSPWIQGDDRFSFEYFGKLIKFGKKLTEKEARLLSQVIEKKMRKHAK
ncbi:MAG: hypothetical protein EBS17_04170 [Flavobacteriia bacterium]|jgi:hypothetical protein|nr:hypothetical protein [Flavobacteriia bacterium]